MYVHVHMCGRHRGQDDPLSCSICFLVAESLTEPGARLMTRNSLSCWDPPVIGPCVAMPTEDRWGHQFPLGAEVTGGREPAEVNSEI